MYSIKLMMHTILKHIVVYANAPLLFAAKKYEKLLHHKSSSQFTAINFVSTSRLTNPQLTALLSLQCCELLGTGFVLKIDVSSFMSYETFLILIGSCPKVMAGVIENSMDFWFLYKTGWQHFLIVCEIVMVFHTRSDRALDKRGY